MIIKGQARGRSQQLASHLLRRDQNEDIRLYELRGVVAQDVEGALAEMEALTAAVHSKRPLYHASISPEAHTPLTPDQIRTAADTLERKLGLTGQPRVIVVHRKKDREHVHVVWSRIDAERQRIISDSWNYRAHEEAARELEAAFGHRVVQGAHGPRGMSSRRRRAAQDYEYRQGERSGIAPAEVGAELTQVWQSSGDAAAFRKKLEEAGYVLARGDRRVFVVIDAAGNAHSLARRLGLKTRDLETRLARLDLDALPSVAEVRSATRRQTRHAAAQTRYRKAAREIASGRRVGSITTIRHRRTTRQFAVAIRWINLPEHAPRPIARRQAERHSIRNRARYLAQRAAILSEYVSKIDDAVAHATPDILASTLARLSDERDAALFALERFEVKREPRAPRGGAFSPRSRRRRRTLRRRAFTRR